jgi:hypothetical protein
MALETSFTQPCVLSRAPRDSRSDADMKWLTEVGWHLVANASGSTPVLRQGSKANKFPPDFQILHALDSIGSLLDASVTEIEASRFLDRGTAV